MSTYKLNKMVRLGLPNFGFFSLSDCFSQFKEIMQVMNVQYWKLEPKYKQEEILYTSIT